jgi:hypothetical protein
MNRLTRSLAAGALAAGFLAGPACSTTQTPLTPEQVGLFTDTILLFRQELQVGGSGFFSFLVSQKQAVSLTYASAMAGDTGPAVPAQLQLGLGVPSGTECVLTAPAVLVGPALTAQVVVEAEPGTYCARVADPGTLAAPLDVAVRILLSFGVAVQNAPATETVATSLAVGGTSMRTVTASATGTLTLTLQNLGEGAGPVGVGVGIPRVDGAGCYLTQSVTTGPGAGPHVSLTVSPGQYCAGVFDIGTLTKPTTYTLQIVRP